MNSNQHLRFFLALILCAGVSVSTLAQTQSAPNAERLRQHVVYLASDALEGRRTGTAGANDAAHYIAGEFSQIGLRPAFQTIRNPRNRAEARSNYRQKFPYIAGVKLGSGNELSYGAETGAVTNLRAGEDWSPVGFSPNTRVEKKQAVFVGYGITAPELNHDDYAGGIVSGKIAIAFSGTPDNDNPHDRFARYKDERWKAIAAHNAGASALVLIVRAEKFQDSHLSRLRYDNSAGASALPVAAVSRGVAQALLGGSSLADLEDDARSGKERASNGRKSFLTLSTVLVREETPAFNIVGVLDGSDPVLKKEAIIIGAHYDHLGMGGEGSLVPGKTAVHHGADDNASGVAGLLELARSFSAKRVRPKRTIIFIAFSGEEEGLLGSSYYVNNPVMPLANTVAMINMDMIGRAKDKKLVIGGVGTAQDWRTLINDAQLAQSVVVDAGNPAAHALSNMPMVVGANGRTVVSSNRSEQMILTLNEDGFGPSDHSSFYAKQIPVLFFWTGTHNDYHKPSDTADKINYEDEVKILQLVARIVRDVSASDKRPTYTLAKSAASSGRAGGFRVYLGTVPNYSDSNDGLLLDGVREDSPAAAAGLKPGDKIVKLAGRDIRNVYDYTAALGEMKAGEEYEVEVVRGAERLKLKIKPAARN